MCAEMVMPINVQPHDCRKTHDDARPAEGARALYALAPQPPLQSCQVWPFQGQKTNLSFFLNWLASKFFDNLLSSCPFFEVYRSL